MYLNSLNTILIATVALLICNINNKVDGKPLSIYENGEQPGIYSDDSWDNKEKDYRRRNTWILDLNDNENKHDINDCNGRGSGCNTKNQGDTILETPVKKEMFSSRSWGAGGMPFNILYMKNPKPPKSLRSQYNPPLPQSSMLGIIAEPLRSQPLMESVPLAQQQYDDPKVYSDSLNVWNSAIGDISPRSASPHQSGQSISNNDNNNNRPKGRSSNNSLFVPSRRHYSIIPQLFVSYGWGPIGK